MVNPSAMSSAPHVAAEFDAQQFRFLAELIPQLVWITDPTGFHTYFNQRWTEFTGYNVEQSRGSEMWNHLLHPDDRQRARDRWNHSLTTGEFYEIEYRFISKDGTYRWFLGQALPRRDEHGVIQQWFGTCTDIQEQKGVAVELQQREEEFMTLANNIPQLAWMTEPDGHIYWYNQRWYEYTGTTLDEMRGWGWSKVHHPDHVDRVLSFVQAAWPAGQAFELTFPLRSAEGTYHWFLTRAVPVRDEQGQVVRWLGTNTDISEQKQMQEQVERAYSDLETKVIFRNLELEREVLNLRRQLGEA